MKTLFLIFISIAIGIGGQFCLKHGVMESSGRIELNSASQVFQQVLMIFKNPYIWFGLCLYALGAITWMLVLSRADISYAYPMLGLAYVIAVFIAWAFKGEPVTSIRWMGVIMISIGVMVIGNELAIRNWIKALAGEQ